MNNNKLTVSHAPFWHDGDSLFQMNLNIMIATLPAVIFGIIQFGTPAVGVLALSLSSAMVWELIMNVISKKKITIGDLDSAVIGLLFGMMLPATSPWWLVITGTFVAVIIGKMIFGGIGANPFNPVLMGMAFLMLSWKVFFDFDAAYVNYEFNFTALAPLAALKFQGAQAVAELFPLGDLIMGKQVGAIGSTFGLGIIIGGIYLILRGYIRWEIPVSFIVGIIVTALCFSMANPDIYAGPGIHLFSGYTLIGAFFLATENSSSPSNRIPMLLYGFFAAVMIILMRNIGVYADGTILAILLLNVVNPLIDTIRPKALGKGVNNA
ncbi:MAG: RnfABCDGE type electron transport complex subunit D [Desulfobacula sp.]|jgi:electron transport complex protein RnfD|uniref:RnfABCDGE type electron transport complex subunit D n=1 Tax=Desulfobacula sp. TaxID=2593537 RepID=UPI001D431C48|nr:RnfABCDGE type electron transport complex subunit D [Desulfobacula sp.]MBT3487070.1 RnfABCDGE type electron transport complex subunit D [Desulfobacula sp.]MBT3806834.1 RnfABCDGE type electron transport complex subunit D [Desulfobacula sp.]MBT4026777.1 RnfABCDGE type electron transport complex subunit D [Desulfobacula sp.]MBT4199040.1 RnfABCDGE type electron transport complex subunit D [Desulfobacula sp.]